MAKWNYNEKDYEPTDYSILPVGNHRVRISEVIEKTFSSGNEGFEIVLDVSGYNSKLWYYLVLLPDNPKQTNQRLGAFFDCFGIADKTVNTGQQWLGKIGAVRVKHEAYKDNMTAKVQYLIAKARQDDLPAWVEPSNSVVNDIPPAANIPGLPEEQANQGFKPAPNDLGLPF